MIELFVRTSFVIGAALMVAAAISVVCGLWWYALGRVRKCAFETYLLCDMRRWMKERQKGREE